MKVLICGGGNAAHVMAGIASSQPDVEARVLTLYADEAERWANAMKDNDFIVTCQNPDGSKTVINKKPALVTKDPAAAMPGIQIIVITVPAFAHGQYLEALEPYVQPGTVLVGLPGQAGFEFAVRGTWGDKAKHCSLLSFESLPWACRMTSFGKTAEVLGTKGTLLGARLDGATPPPEDATAMLQKSLGPLPVLTATGHLLGITLTATNGYVHPSIMYGRWHNWDGKPLDEPALFYNGLDRPSADLLSAVSDELVATAKAIMQQRPQVDLNSISHVYQWYLRCYSEDIVDKTDLYSCIQTNRAYTGLNHPMQKTADGKFVPDFKHRYTTEDIPFGLVVMRGIAEIAGVPTPNMDKILRWVEKVSGKEYLSGGKIAGKDLGETRAPQRYNLMTLDTMLGLD